MRQAGNRFLDPVSLGRPDEGIGGFYLSAGGDDQNILTTAATTLI